jgi:LysR family transcriptional regulator, nitrogen assimilation regulatory protein
VETRKLAYFVKIVDLGSITKAAAALHVAQPALSQQMASLEAEFHQALLIRSKQGVSPTAAGLTLYRHAMAVLPMLERTFHAVANSGGTPHGRVSIAIAPHSMAATLAPAMVRAVRGRYPDIVLHITEIFGGVLSEAVVNGALDIALIYEPGPIPGIHFTTLTEESLSVVGLASSRPGAEKAIPLAEIVRLPLLLPERNHTIRQVIEAEAVKLDVALNVVSEVESIPSLIRLVDDGLGWTVMPVSAANAYFSEARYGVWQLVDPPLHVKFALCSADHEPLSEAAAAVLMTLRELFQTLA